MELNDGVLQHLREVTSRPDLSGTRYELGEEIGRGGLGLVYVARDPRLDRMVAIKVIDAELAEEAPLIARLEHPAIVPVYESGSLPDGREWYAMKLVQGEALDRHADGRRPLAESLRIFRTVCEAVRYAHASGVLHRDLKPGNIMVGAFGEVYVLDWGVAAVAGTPEYRAPEDVLEARSDIYSLGAILRFLAGQDAPRALFAIAEKASSPTPQARYAGVAELLRDLDRFENGLAVEAWREPLWHRMRRFGSRNAVLLWLLAAFAAAKFAIYFLRSR